MPWTLQAAGKNKIQHLLENKPHKVGEVGYRGHTGSCSVTFQAIPLACVGQCLGKDSDTLTHP